MTELMWLSHHILATTMFFGVLLTRSQSTAMDLTLCSLTVVLIGIATNLIATLDTPYLSLDRSGLVYVITQLEIAHEKYGGKLGSSQKLSAEDERPSLKRTR